MHGQARGGGGGEGAGRGILAAHVLENNPMIARALVLRAPDAREISTFVHVVQVQTVDHIVGIRRRVLQCGLTQRVAEERAQAVTQCGHGHSRVVQGA